MEDLIKRTGLLPIEPQNSKITILMDINLLPTKYKEDEEGIKNYERDYDVKVIPYDSSRSNISGNFHGAPQIVKIA